MAFGSFVSDPCRRVHKRHFAHRQLRMVTAVKRVNSARLTSGAGPLKRVNTVYRRTNVDVTED